MNELNQVDLAFVVDTTGSMGAFIQSAQRQMIALIQAVSTAAATPIDLCLGVVEFRDHPPQDQSFVARPHPFTGNLQKSQKIINELKPEGGGDAPEAVYDGLSVACEQLAWREHSQRLAILVGDSPPHGTGAGGDGFAKGCPCGQTTETVTALLEQKCITLYAVGLHGGAAESFGRLARFTGGDYFASQHGEEALEALRGVLAREFDDLDFDRRVLVECQAGGGWTLDSLGLKLESPRSRLSASLSRLGRRGLVR